MGITINETIEQLQDAKDGYKEYLTNETLDVAIEAIERCRKIKEIMKSKRMNALNIGLLIPKDMAYVLHEIKEVIENGNDKI